MSINYNGFVGYGPAQAGYGQKTEGYHDRELRKWCLDQALKLTAKTADLNLALKLAGLDTFADQANPTNSVTGAAEIFERYITGRTVH